MGKTSIEWTDRTWNPTRGCSRVSAGCTRCYAERQAARFAKGDLDNKNNGDQPFHSFVTKVNGHASWTGKVELIESKLLEPLSWKTPARIFVNSMSDLFHEALTDEAIDRVFAVMALCPQHTFQVLTKRPARMLEWFGEETWGEGTEPIPFSRIGQQQIRLARAIAGASKSKPNSNGTPAKTFALTLKWPLPNVHLGVSVEDQKTADERIPLLLKTPAAKRFVSYEPALGPVDFSGFLFVPHWEVQESAEELRHREDCPCGGTGIMPSPLHQIIVGGESGPGARPFDITWPRQTLTQCRAANVAFFMKQFGAQPYEEVARQDVTPHPVYGDEVVCYTELAYLRLKDRKGGDMSEWPEDLRVRELI